MAFDPINYEGQDRLAHIEKYVGQNTAAIAVLNGGSISAVQNELMPLRVQPTIKTIFASGHGYTASGAGSSTLNDTSDFAMGKQCATVVTTGSGGGALLKKTGMTSFDMTGCCFCVWFKVADITHFVAASIYAGDTSLANNFIFDLYPSQAKYFFSGEWVCIVVPWAPTSTTGSPNRAAITDLQLRVADDNTANPVTMHWGGIATLPEPTLFSGGVATICFDDGFVDSYTEGRAKLDQYGFAASIFPIQDLIDTPGGTYMSLAQLKDLQNNHGWDVCAHAYTVANHNLRFANLSDADLDTELTLLRKWLTTNNFRGLDHFAYPGGSVSAGDFTLANEAIVRKYFSTARTTVQTPNVYYPPAMPYRLRSFTVTSSTTTAQIQTAIDNAVTGKYWLILTFHKLLSAKVQTSDFLISDFGTIVDYLNTKGIPVKPISDVLAAR